MSKFHTPPLDAPEQVQYTVRGIRDGDAPDVLRLLIGDKTAADMPPEDDMRHPKHETERLLAAGRESDPKGMGWLAILDGRAVGIITTKDGFNGGIYVEPGHQGKHIGEGLVTAREEFQRSHGETEAHATIVAGNKRSIKLHERMGYERAPGSEGEAGKMPPDRRLQFVKPLQPK